MKFNVSAVAPGREVIDFGPDAAELSDELATAVERLAALPPLEYDRQRQAEVQALGVRAATLDQAVARWRGKLQADAGRAEGGMLLADPEPWPEPVNGAELLDSVAAAVARYLVLPAGAANAVALWTLHTHAHDSATVSAVLGVTSPTPECGKSTLLTFLAGVVARPLPASNITAAALFRAVEKWRPTVLVDEADTFLRESDELRGIVNSGHHRANAWVIRTVGDEHEPRQFATWAPKAIALIGRLPPTLASRAIHIELRRMTPAEHIEPLRLDRPQHLCDLQRQAARWASDCLEEVRSADPAMPAGLYGRAADNWRHLLAIADTAGGEWPERARTAAETLSVGRTEQTAGIMLLEDIRRIIASDERDAWPSAELAERLTDMEDRPWPEWRAGKSLTARQIARLLEPFGIGPHPIRVDTRQVRGYRERQFADAFARYLPPEPSQRHNPHGDADSPGKASVTRSPDCDASQPPANRATAPGVTGVTDDPEEGEL